MKLLELTARIAGSITFGTFDMSSVSIYHNITVKYTDKIDKGLHLLTIQ